jgi:hypothetical protein
MRLIVSVFIAAVFCSCGRKSANQMNDVNSVKVIDLLSEPESEITSLSEIESDIEYIPLETNNNSMIKNIDKVKIRDNYIYIKNNVLDVMCFDSKGQFLYKLDKSGRGPEEYTYINDYDISSDNNTLLVLSIRKILEYNISETGFSFLKSIYLNQPAPVYLSFIPGTNNILLSVVPWQGTEPALNILINKDGDTLYLKNNCYRYEKANEINFYSATDAIQYAFDNSVYFKEVFSDTIFSVSKASNNFIPRLIFDSHGTIVNTKFRSDLEYSKSHSGEYSQIAYISEVPRYIFYYCMLKGVRYKIFYDKADNKKLEMNPENTLKDDICGGPGFNLGMNAATEGKFYSSVEALALKKYVKSVDFSKAKVQHSQKKEELKKLADSLEETDNPILIVVTPKN